jgi:hypothetical protein
VIRYNCLLLLEEANAHMAFFLIDEIKYYLNDTAMEEKLGFSLVKSLDRAKNGSLLAGHTFYLTSNISPKPEILSRVIVANGGQVRRRSPVPPENLCLTPLLFTFSFPGFDTGPISTIVVGPQNAPLDLV